MFDLKRPLEFLDQELLDAEENPAKVLKGPGPEDEQWVCEKCGNSNYGHRVICNMRSCGAPRDQEPWVCPGCGNENYPNRVFCNMRRCQQVRPGVTMKQIQAATAAPTVPTMSLGPALRGPPPVMYQPMPSLPMAMATRTDEPWTCVCGNENYAGRTICNLRSCGKPRPAPPRPQPFSGPLGPPQFTPAFSPAPYGGSLKHAASHKEGGAPPPGSWKCVECNNVNWPNRNSCNGRSCGKPRSEVDGGPVEAPPKRTGGPPGSWICPACFNVNFPERLFCNKRTCGKAKPGTGMDLM